MATVGISEHVPSATEGSSGEGKREVRGDVGTENVRLTSLPRRWKATWGPTIVTGSLEAAQTTVPCQNSVDTGYIRIFDNIHDTTFCISSLLSVNGFYSAYFFWVPK